MSLMGALEVGKSSLAAQQAALQVTGNNIANAGTAGYTRQTVDMTPAGVEQVGTNQYVGTGVNIGTIDRQTDAALEESLRQATSSQTSAQTLSNSLNQLEGTFGALNSNDLASRLSTFFNNFSTLANNPQDSGQRSIVIQGGVSLASYMQSLRTSVVGQLSTADAQISTLASQANTLTQSIATLNTQISTAEAGGGDASSLRDQRDQSLTQLASLINIRVVPQTDGSINVLVGNTPVIQGGMNRGISTKSGSDPTGQFPSTQLTFADNGDNMQVTGGQIGALIDARDNYHSPAVTAIDTIASSLINTVNSIHSQGQGLAGFSSVTGATQISDANAALNTTTIGLPSTPVNGTFNLNLTDATTGQVTTKQISVNLSGTGAPTTLASLAAAITAAGGGSVSATVTAAGQLAVTSSSSNTTFSFSDDSSGALAALGVNTFFTGSNASNISVNQTLQSDSDYLATGRDNIAGSNRNAQAIATAGGAVSAALGGKSITDYYSGYIGNLAVLSKNAADDATAQTTIQSTISAQREAISGVDMNEEAINLTKYQQAFNGSAHYIATVQAMMTALLAMIAA